MSTKTEIKVHAVDALRWLMGWVQTRPLNFPVPGSEVKLSVLWWEFLLGRAAGGAADDTTVGGIEFYAQASLGDDRTCGFQVFVYLPNACMSLHWSPTSDGLATIEACDLVNVKNDAPVNACLILKQIAIEMRFPREVPKLADVAEKLRTLSQRHVD